MSKRLESLIERVSTWPQEAQEEAARLLEQVERQFAETIDPQFSPAEVELLRIKIDESLAAPGPDVSLDEAFARIRELHAKRVAESDA